MNNTALLSRPFLPPFEVTTPLGSNTSDGFAGCIEATVGNALEGVESVVEHAAGTFSNAQRQPPGGTIRGGAVVAITT